MMSESDLISDFDGCDTPVAPTAPKVPAVPMVTIVRKPKIVKRVGRKPSLMPAGTYRCPKCSNEIIVFIRMSALPLCINHSASSGGAVQMEEVK